MQRQTSWWPAPNAESTSVAPPASGSAASWLPASTPASNDRANRMTWPRGRMRYNVAMLIELGVFRAVPYVLELDGEPWETSAMLVVAGNIPSYGGGMKVTPGRRH